MAVECVTPPDCQGDLVGDLNRRRGRVHDIALKGALTVIGAEVPLAEMFGYANAIRSLSKGRAEFSMVPDHYETVPAELAAKILVRR